jgi:hypothetical protein
MDRDYKQLIVIGRKSKRSKLKKHVLPVTTTGYIKAMTMELYSGHLWGILKDGKRRHIKDYNGTF